jgi:hypothetical protein
MITFYGVFVLFTVYTLSALVAEYYYTGVWGFECPECGALATNQAYLWPLRYVVDKSWPRCVMCSSLVWFLEEVHDE